MASKLLSFREPTLFSRDIYRHLTEESYFTLQDFLLEYPEEGDLIRGSGGLRKLRWVAKGRGKRGGVRIIYYLADARGYIFLLDIYPKTAKEDLTADEIKQLRALNKERLDEERKIRAITTKHYRSGTGYARRA